MSLMIELHGGEDARQIEAHLAALKAYRNEMMLNIDPESGVDLNKPSGGALMALRAQEDADQALLLEKFGPMAAGMPRESETIRQSAEEVAAAVHHLASLPPVPAAPVSAVPPVPPAPSAADAGASATAPAAPLAGVPPLPPAVPLPPASPSAPAVAATPAAPAPALDASGLPWDGRIHSESRAQVADGTWRRRRGVDQAVVDSVTAELRALHGQSAAPLPPTIPAVPATALVAPIPAAPATTAKAPDVPTATAPASGTASPTTSAAASTVAVPPVPPAPIAATPVAATAPTPPTPPAGAPGPDPFEHFFKHQYLAAMQQGYVVQSGVQQALAWLQATHQLPNILALKQRMDLLPAFIEQVPGLAEFVALQQGAGGAA